MAFLKKIGSFIGKAVSAVGKFASSPFGKLLINVGLGVLTGGASSLLGGLGGNLLGSLGGGGLGKLFGGFAQNFLGQASSWLSKSGLGGIVDFGKQLLGGNSSNVLDYAKNLFSAKQSQPQKADPATQQIADHNARNVLAWIQAQQLIRAQVG